MLGTRPASTTTVAVFTNGSSASAGITKSVTVITYGSAPEASVNVSFTPTRGSVTCTPGPGCQPRSCWPSRSVVDHVPDLADIITGLGQRDRRLEQVRLVDRCPDTVGEPDRRADTDAVFTNGSSAPSGITKSFTLITRSAPDAILKVSSTPTSGSVTVHSKSGVSSGTCWSA